jgi:hypothetical protein
MLSQQVFFGYSFPRETFGDGMYKRWHSWISRMNSIELI